MLTRNAPRLLESSLPCTCTTATSFTLPKSGPPPPTALTHAPKLDSFERPIVGANFLPPRPLFPLQSVQCLRSFHQWWILLHRNCFAGMYTFLMMWALMTELSQCLSTGRCIADVKSSCIVDLDVGGTWVVVGIRFEFLSPQARSALHTEF
jgi:hypothetical protein